ncbi:MAG: response regulator [Anaerolineales bacterium]
MKPINQPVFVYVEDDPLSREIIQVILEKQMGETVYAMDSTADFVGTIAGFDHTPNVFLFDIHMRPRSGFDLLNELRASDGYADATIVALTASVMNEEVQTLRTAGFDSIIAKPIDQERFPRDIAQILRGEPVWQI